MVTVLRLEGAQVNGDEEEVVLETNMIDDGTEEFDQAILAVDTRKVLETLQDEDKAPTSFPSQGPDGAGAPPDSARGSPRRHFVP